MNVGGSGAHISRASVGTQHCALRRVARVDDVSPGPFLRPLRLRLCAAKRRVHQEGCAREVPWRDCEHVVQVGLRQRPAPWDDPPREGGQWKAGQWRRRCGGGGGGRRCGYAVHA